MHANTLDEWIGRSEKAVDILSPAPLAGLAATLDHALEDAPWCAGELPPLAHWLYFLPRARQEQIGIDGHPQRGGFLPPIELPRRMWASSAIRFELPLVVGASVSRLSTITGIETKNGRQGKLVFVTLEHELTTVGATAPAIVEHQQIVYRAAAARGEAPSESASLSTVRPPPCDWSRELTPDPTLLFRFSALTFNAHRIHYDRDYCRDVEGYPGLVVHGPLSATLLLDLFLRQYPGAQVRAFSFRAKRALIDTHPLRLCGKQTATGGDLWILDADGNVAMSAEVELR